MTAGADWDKNNRPGHFGPDRPITFDNAHLFSLFGLLNVRTNCATL